MKPVNRDYLFPFFAVLGENEDKIEYYLSNNFLLSLGATNNLNVKDMVFFLTAFKRWYCYFQYFWLN